MSPTLKRPVVDRSSQHPWSVHGGRRACLATALALAVPFAAGLAHAQSAAAPAFGSQPVRMVVGASPGGTTDLIARTVGQEMSRILGTPVVTENRAGAGGNIAADQVAKAAPDGHTLLTSFTSHGVNAALYPNLPFDTLRDFTAITILAQAPSLLVARNDLPFKDVPGLISHAKANPAKLNFALGGVGSSLHMATEQFKYMAGIDIVGVPYKGTSPAVADLLGGHMDLMFAAIGNAIAHVKAGKLRLLAVTSAERMPEFPDIPTVGETVKGFESVAWFGLFGPAGLPEPVLTRLNETARKALESKAVSTRFQTDGLAPVGNSSAEAAAFVASEVKKWSEVVKATGAKPE